MAPRAGCACRLYGVRTNPRLKTLANGRQCHPLNNRDGRERSGRHSLPHALV
jgi:hypothetical protein